MLIYLVDQLCESTWGLPVHHETLRAFTKVASAKAFCNKRAGVFTWVEHNSHGRSWESRDGDGKYVVVEIELE